MAKSPRHEPRGLHSYEISNNEFREVSCRQLELLNGLHEAEAIRTNLLILIHDHDCVEELINRLSQRLECRYDASIIIVGSQIADRGGSRGIVSVR